MTAEVMPHARRRGCLNGQRVSVELCWCIEDTGGRLDWARPGGLQLRSRRSVWLHGEGLMLLCGTLHEVVMFNVQLTGTTSGGL